MLHMKNKFWSKMGATVNTSYFMFSVCCRNWCLTERHQKSFVRSISRAKKIGTQKDAILFARVKYQEVAKLKEESCM